MGVREIVNKNPAVGWSVAAILAVVTVVLLIRNLGGGETAELTETVTIRCRETGHEWVMKRGEMEKQLMLRPYPVNPEEGLINPETGKPTGFPVDSWKQTVEMINAERAELAGGGSSPAPARGGR